MAANTNYPDYYEVLQVHPSAAPEVIQTAYRTLAKKYRYDLLADKDQATKIMAQLNQAYSVLSDPEQRRQYDASFAGAATNGAAPQQQAEFAGNRESSPLEQQVLAARELAKTHGEELPKNLSLSLGCLKGIGCTFSGSKNYDRASRSYITRHWFTLFYIPLLLLGEYRVICPAPDRYIIVSKLPNKFSLKRLLTIYFTEPLFIAALLILLLVAASQTIAVNPGPQPATSPSRGGSQASPAASPAASQSAARSNNLPDNTPEFVPKTNVLTQYLPNEPIANADGYWQLSLDNSKNDFPVVVRLWSLSDTARPVRAFSIKAGDKFTADNLTVGKYEVRYMHLYENIPSTDAFKSDPITLWQKETDDGVNYSIVTLTLYKVPHGNNKIRPIKPSEI